MLIFEVTKKFPKEETYSLTDQIRRSSRSVYANLAELGGSGAIRQLSSLKYLMLKEKLRKPSVDSICRVIRAGYLQTGRSNPGLENRCK